MFRESKKKGLTEKPSAAAAEVDKKGEADFEKLAGEIQSDIQQLSVDFNGKLVELESVNAHKENSKGRYQRELDAGNEEGMSSCLKQVRERNEQAAKLRSELAIFPVKVEEFYTRQTKLFAIVRAGQEMAEVNLRAAEKALELAGGKVKRCYAVQGLINGVNTSIQDLVRVHKKEKKAFEDEVRVPRDNSRGFWLELDDPFAAGTLRTYENLKASIDQPTLQKKFKASEALRSEFSDLKSYMDSERKIILKSKDLDDMNLPCVLSYEDKETKVTLENYILRAAGSGDRRREFAAKVALSKCR